jgi:hypothetical protein
VSSEETETRRGRVVAVGNRRRSMVSSLLGASYDLNRALHAAGQCRGSEHEFARNFGPLRVTIGRASRRAARVARPGLPERFFPLKSLQDFINHLSQPASTLQPTPTGSEEKGILMADRIST